VLRFYVNRKGSERRFSKHGRSDRNVFKDGKNVQTNSAKIVEINSPIKENAFEEHKAKQDSKKVFDSNNKQTKN
jgi:hypothetical protein